LQAYKEHEALGIARLDRYLIHTRGSGKTPGNAWETSSHFTVRIANI